MTWLRRWRRARAIMLCLFFFSSGRRHTRCGRDWSSDVCSSDLVGDDARLEHLAQQVVSFTGALADSGEYRKTRIPFGDVVDQLLDQYGFADPGTTEESDFTTLGIRLDQVDDLDAGVQDFVGSGQVFEFRRLAVDGVAVFFAHRSDSVDRVAGDVEQTAADFIADRHFDGRSRIHHFGAAGNAVGGVHRDGTHGVLTNVLLAFQHQFRSVFTGDFQDVVDLRQAFFICEVNIDNRSNDLKYSSGIASHFYKFDAVPEGRFFSAAKLRFIRGIANCVADIIFLHLTRPPGALHRAPIGKVGMG